MNNLSHSIYKYKYYFVVGILIGLQVEKVRLY